MQPFKAERGFSFSSPHTERGRKDGVDVSVLHNEGATGEVRIEVELEPPRDSAAEVRAQPAEREVVDVLLVVIVQRKPAVRMNQQSDLQPEVPISRLGGKAILTTDETRRRRLSRWLGRGNGRGSRLRGSSYGCAGKNQQNNQTANDRDHTNTPLAPSAERALRIPLCEDVRLSIGRVQGASRAVARQKPVFEEVQKRAVIFDD